MATLDFERQSTCMNLTNAKEGKGYIIQQIDTDDDELNAFPFSLSRCSGEQITVVSHPKKAVLFPSRMPATTSTIIWRRRSLSE